MSEAAKMRGAGTSSPKDERIRLGGNSTSSGDDHFGSSADIGEGGNNTNRLTGKYASPRTSPSISPSKRLPSLHPLRPSHTTSTETLRDLASTQDRPDLDRRDLPSVSPSLPRSANRASLLNLINQDSNVGFSIHRDVDMGGSAISPSSSKSPNTVLPSLPRMELPPISNMTSLPPTSSKRRNSLLLSMEEPVSKDPRYTYTNSFKDDGIAYPDMYTSSASRSRPDFSSYSGIDSRQYDIGPPRQAPSGSGLAVPPISSPPLPLPPPAHHDPEFYVSRDQAWFVLGNKLQRDSHIWSVDRIGWYNEGFEDAVEAVKGGMIGCDGKRYVNPIFWQPQDLNRSLLEMKTSSRTEKSQMSFPVGNPDTYDPMWPQYGSAGPSNSYRYVDPQPASRRKTSPGSKSGKRLPISCHPCRKRKLKCDGQTPCGPCVKRESTDDCAYEKDIKRRGKGRKQMDEDEWNQLTRRDEIEERKSGIERDYIRPPNAGSSRHRQGKAKERMTLKGGEGEDEDEDEDEDEVYSQGLKRRSRSDSSGGTGGGPSRVMQRSSDLDRRKGKQRQVEQSSLSVSSDHLDGSPSSRESVSLRPTSPFRRVNQDNSLGIHQNL